MNKKILKGFTLIELIVVITLTGIIALFVGRNITRPIEGFIDLGQRAELVDIAELTLRRMSRELRLALPNSVRISGGSPCNAPGGSAICAVEILRTLDGGRYRDKPGGAGVALCPGPPAQDRLSFTSNNDCFEVLGTLNNLPVVAPGADQDDCLDGTVDCLVIFNTGQIGANAYNRDNIAGIQAANTDAMSFDISGVAGVTRFPLKSPRQRFHVVDMPVSYVCNPGVGIIERHGDYDISLAQVLDPGGTLNGNVSVLADKVTACSFTFDPGTNTRNGLLTADITVSSTDTQGNANTVRLVEQIQVPNIP